MSYREYVPTCVEALFGKPSTKFKARAIVRESKNGYLDPAHCVCCYCEKHNGQKKGPVAQEDFFTRDMVLKCFLNCPDCRRQSNNRNEIRYRYNAGTTEKRGYVDRSLNKRIENGICECFCSKCECPEEGKYTQERNRTKPKINKKNNNVGPSRSISSQDHSDSDRFCNVCHLWVRSDSSEKREEYSNKMYEDQVEECIEACHRKKKTNVPKGFHFVIESCKFCGSGQNGANVSVQKGEDPCKGLKSIDIETEEICEYGRKVEECSHSEGFYEVQRNNESFTNGSGEDKALTHEIYEQLAEKIGALENFLDKPGVEVPIQSVHQEDASSVNNEPNYSSQIKNSFSASEINNIETRYKNMIGNSQDLEQKSLISESKEETAEDSVFNTGFRSCECQFAQKIIKEDKVSKIETDKSEIRILKQKCDEALYQLEIFKREIADSKQGKCQCDLRTTMNVVEDCKYRCAQLEKQVVMLQHTIERYTQSTVRDPEVMDRNNPDDREIRRTTRVKEAYRVKDARRKSQQRNHGINQTQSGNNNNNIRRNVKQQQSPRKPRDPCAPQRIRHLGCQHMKCFPPEQVPDIPSFKTCPGYSEVVEKAPYKR